MRSAWRYTIRGNPADGSKNRKVIRRWGSRVGVGRTETYRAWLDSAVAQLREQGGPIKLGGRGNPLAVNLIAYVPKGARPDIDNLLAGPLDALQRAGVISNDYWVREISAERLRDEAEPRVEIEVLW